MPANEAMARPTGIGEHSGTRGQGDAAAQLSTEFGVANRDVTAGHQHDQREPGRCQEQQHRVVRVHPVQSRPAHQDTGQDLADHNGDSPPRRGRQQRTGDTDRQDQGEAGQGHSVTAFLRSAQPTLIKPSWTTVASIPPSAAKKCPLANPLEPEALGEWVS